MTQTVVGRWELIGSPPHPFSLAVMVMVDKEVAKVADQVTREVQSAMTQTVVGRWELIGSPRTFLTMVMVMMVDKVSDQG